jgi:hypothetical protein
MISCSPSSLANAARCFKSCVAQGQVQAVKTYLACQVARVGVGAGMSSNIIPPGSMYPSSGIPVFNLTVLANSVYQITWGANDQSMTMGSETYVGGGNGSKTIVYTNGNTNMAFLGTANGTLVTVVLQLAPKAVPIPGDFTWVADAGFANVVGTWDTPPANVTKTELWTSTDNITFTLNQTIAAPGTTASVPLPAVGSTIYAKVRWFIVTQGAFSGVLQYLNTDWLTRVIANFGRSPTNAVIKAVNDFYNQLGNVGILSNMLVVNPFAFGSVGGGSALATLETPLIRGSGRDPWLDHNLTNANATINGFVGGGFMRTGFIPSAGFASINSAGQSIYNFTSIEDGTNYDCGGYNSVDAIFSIHVKSVGNTLYDAFSLANRVSVASSGSGFYSVNRVSATDLRLYFGNSTNATAQVGSTSALGAGAMPAIEVDVSALALDNAGNAFGTSNQTHSFWAAHTGLTITQADLLKQAVQAMRVAMGGGFV